jgi:hypothetical protein
MAGSGENREAVKLHYCVCFACFLMPLMVSQLSGQFCLASNVDTVSRRRNEWYSTQSVTGVASYRIVDAKGVGERWWGMSACSLRKCRLTGV